MDKATKEILEMAERMEELKHKKKQLAKGQRKKRADHKHEYILIPYSLTDSSLPSVQYAKVCKQCGYINNIHFGMFEDIKELSTKIPLIKDKIYYGKIDDKFLPGFQKGMFEKGGDKP